MHKIKIGRINKQQQTMRGWLTGQFFPKGSPFKDDNVEICCKTLPIGDPSDKLHQHPYGKEYLVVVKGRAIIQVGGQQFEIKEGDYLAIPANTPEKMVKVIEEITFFGIRCPSVPDNKTLLE